MSSATAATISTLAWVTTAAARGRDDDEQPALTALEAEGVSVDVVEWDDPDVAWARYDRAVLRSVWDYPERLPQFRAWLRSVSASTDLRNPLELVDWNLDKHYLADLDRAGVPIIPTTFVEPGDPFDPPDGDYVLKPAIGAGSKDAASYGPQHGSQARAHVARLHERGICVLSQPLLASVATDGEWPLVFFGGEFSHAAGKHVDLPRGGQVEGLFAVETTATHLADAEQRAVAAAAVEVVARHFGRPMYARVDLVRDDAGRSRVLELELVEPSLFLPQGGPDAATRMAAAFAR